MSPAVAEIVTPWLVAMVTIVLALRGMQLFYRVAR